MWKAREINLGVKASQMSIRRRRALHSEIHKNVNKSLKDHRNSGLGPYSRVLFFVRNLDELNDATEDRIHEVEIGERSLKAVQLLFGRKVLRASVSFARVDGNLGLIGISLTGFDLWE